MMVDTHDHAPELCMHSFCRIDMNRHKIGVNARKLSTGMGHTPMVRANATIGREAIGVDARCATDQRPSASLYRVAIMRSYTAHSHLPRPANDRQNKWAAITAARSDAARAVMIAFAGRRAGIDLI